jgi:arsenate reductase
MHLDSNELTILYNQGNERDKKTLIYAYTITNKINKQELSSVRVSSTLFQVFVNKLNEDPKSLINKSDPYYQEHIRGKNFSTNGWFDILTNHPNLLKAPLAMYHNKAIVCNTPTDILRLS